MAGKNSGCVGVTGAEIKRRIEGGDESEMGAGEKIGTENRSVRPGVTVDLLSKLDV